MFDWLDEKREDCVESGMSDGIYLTILLGSVVLNIATFIYWRIIRDQMQVESARFIWCMRVATFFQIVAIVLVVIELIKLRKDWFLD